MQGGAAQGIGEAVARLVVEPPTPLRRIVPQLDELLLWFVERAMARNPNDRFSSADEMLEALERFEVDATRVDHRMEERLSVDDAIPPTAQHAVRHRT